MAGDPGKSIRRPARALAVVTLLLVATGASASDDPRARTVLDRLKALDRGERHWTDRRQTLTFHIYAGGSENTRALRVYERRARDDTHKVLVRFSDPSDVRDVGILVVTAAHGGGQQWLYTPEFKRDRMLDGARRNDKIAGSDLSYNDLELITALPGWDQTDADATLRTEETVDGVACQVIELAPKRTDVAYRLIRMWLGTDDLVVRRLELFRDGDVPAKRLTQTDIRPVGRIPVAHRVVAETLRDGSRTEIAVAETVFDGGIGDVCFARGTLDDPTSDASACAGTSPPAAP